MSYSRIAASVLGAAFILTMIVNASHAQTASQLQKPAQKSPPKPSQHPLQAFMLAYPDCFDSASATTLYWKDGTCMSIDTARQLPDVSTFSEERYEQYLNAVELREQVAQCYPTVDTLPRSLPRNYEPGRARHEAMFLKMYGASEEAVMKTLVTVPWMPHKITGNRAQTVAVTRTNGIAERVQAISAALEQLSDSLMPYVTDIAGGFAWRPIAGTHRHSAHSFGAAIDINVGLSNYWRYDKPEADGTLRYRNRIPREIVRVFEQHGFIWGGWWYHYDTMHFEYRPELLVGSQRCR